jgi:hypothetical protein
MRASHSILLALLFFPGAAASGQESTKSIEGPGFVVGVNTYFDFGPPFNYYDIFVVTPTPQGSKVGKFTLTPLVHKCYAPEKTEYVEKTTKLSVKELLAGEDPCEISENDLKREQKRKKKGLNFSGAQISLQLSCGGETRTIQASVIERDWFLAHPGTPKNTGWTMELLDKLGSLTGPGVGDKPAFPTMETGPVVPLSADPTLLENLRAGKYDGLFPGAQEKASEIYRGSLVPLPQPTVALVSSTPVEPVHFTLPVYPHLPWIVAHEGETSVALLLDPEGNVSSLVMFMGMPLFEGAVRDAVKDWKFPPAPPTTEILPPLREVAVSFSFQLNCKADQVK